MQIITNIIQLSWVCLNICLNIVKANKILFLAQITTFYTTHKQILVKNRCTNKRLSNFLISG